MISKIAWMTPWNGQSAIANFSAHVVRELRERGCRVQIVRTESAEGLALAPLDDIEPVLSLAHIAPESLACEALVANIGNYFPYHGALPAFMDEYPVLGIFHDGFLADFAAAWADGTNGGNVTPTQLASAVYGDLGPDPYWLPLAKMAEERSMLEWLSPMVSGAVVHSSSWAARLRESCPGDVLVQPLAMPDDEMPSPPEPRDDRLVVASIGYVNPNRHAEQVLYALASHGELRRRCEFRLIGPVTSETRVALESLALDLGLRRPSFTGWVEDAELRRLMATVDVLCCLRYPILETGSASLITAMRSARPVLVSDHGGYAEVPGDLVYRCSPGAEALDVARHLLAIMNDRAAAAARGGRARSHSLDVNSARHYVDGLLPALARATAAAPMVRSARNLGRQIGGLGLPADNETARRLGSQLSAMFGDYPGSGHA